MFLTCTGSPAFFPHSLPQSNLPLCSPLRLSLLTLPAQKCVPLRFCLPRRILTSTLYPALPSIQSASLPLRLSVLTSAHTYVPLHLACGCLFRQVLSRAVTRGWPPRRPASLTSTPTPTATFMAAAFPVSSSLALNGASARVLRLRASYVRLARSTVMPLGPLGSLLANASTTAST